MYDIYIYNIYNSWVFGTAIAASYVEIHVVAGFFRCKSVLAMPHGGVLADHTNLDHGSPMVFSTHMVDHSAPWVDLETPNVVKSICKDIWGLPKTVDPQNHGYN